MVACVSLTFEPSGTVPPRYRRLRDPQPKPSGGKQQLQVQRPACLGEQRQHDVERLAPQRLCAALRVVDA